MRMLSDVCIKAKLPETKPVTKKVFQFGRNNMKHCLSVFEIPVGGYAKKLFPNSLRKCFEAHFVVLLVTSCLWFNSQKLTMNKQTSFQNQRFYSSNADHHCRSSLKYLSCGRRVGARLVCVTVLFFIHSSSSLILFFIPLKQFVLRPLPLRTTSYIHAF
jgi:hypothetical protein